MQALFPIKLHATRERKPHPLTPQIPDPAWKPKRGELEQADKEEEEYEKSIEVPAPRGEGGGFERAASPKVSSSSSSPPSSSSDYGNLKRKYEELKKDNKELKKDNEEFKRRVHRLELRQESLKKIFDADRAYYHQKIDNLERLLNAGNPSSSTSSPPPS